MKQILKALFVIAGMCLTAPIRAQASFEEDETSRNETLKVHIVPHSYNKNFLRTIDAYFPNMQQELLQAHFDKLLD
jgi:hypothetical protein